MMPEIGLRVGAVGDRHPDAERTNPPILSALHHFVAQLKPNMHFRLELGLSFPVYLLRAEINHGDVMPPARPAREANVIDITGAEIVTDFPRGVTGGTGIRPPLIRPVPIPPPNVRIL